MIGEKFLSGFLEYELTKKIHHSFLGVVNDANNLHWLILKVDLFIIVVNSQIDEFLLF